MHDHSEGDWTIATCLHTSQRPSFTVVSGHNTIAQVLPLCHHDPDTAIARQYANARLLAAAPRMLAAIEACKPWLGVLIAERAHLRSAAPSGAEMALARISDVLAEIRDGTRPPTDETPKQETPQ